LKPDFFIPKANEEEQHNMEINKRSIKGRLKGEKRKRRKEDKNR
jgi:hypothetical protein